MLSSGTFKQSFDLRGPKNFYCEYESFEAALSNQNKMYDLLRYKFTLVFYYHMVAMSDHTMSKMINTFQLKTLYNDVWLCILLFVQISTRNYQVI